MNEKRVLILIIMLPIAGILLYLLAVQPDSLIPALNALLMIALPLGLGIFLRQRLGLSWGLFGAGALTFIGSQVLHIPFNIYLLDPLIKKMGLQFTPGSPNLMLIGLFLGLSAGIFEETARYIVLRYWRKDARNWQQILMFGAGHGGVEAIILGVFGFIGFLQLVVYRDMGTQALENMVSGQQLQALQTTLNAFWSLSWYDHLWGSLERFSAICIHLGATVLVFQSLLKRNIVWFILAVLWHALVDFLAVFGLSTWGIPITEGIFLVLGLLSLGIVFAFRQPKSQQPVFEPELQTSSLGPSSLPAKPPLAEELTIEKLEKSRYD